MTNGIKVYVRVRPTKIPSGFFQQHIEDQDRLEFNIPSDVARTYVNNSRSKHHFKFDGILDQEIKQGQVFDQVAKESLNSCLEGYNATIFAYGQTGSGKTFTITGGAERYEDRGIIPRALSYLYSEINKRSDVQFNIRISYLEIYNDNGYDLLSPEHETKDASNLPKVIMKEDDSGNVTFENLKTHLAASEDDALNLLFLGDTNRAIGETPMNLASSRSHCIFSIFIEQREENSSKIKRSKIHLVDLAGSERVHKTSAAGQILREAKHINTSLHYLEMVIVALHERKTKGRTHIPYRNSMMTSVLRDSLGGNCRTSMIATISAERSETEETLSTCRFAQRVALVENDAFVNEEVDPSMVIKRLREQIAVLKEEIAFLKGERDLSSGESKMDETDEDEVQRLRQVIKSWLNIPPPSIGGPNTESEVSEGKFGSEDLLQPGNLTFDRIHTCFNILKTEFHRKTGSGSSNNSKSTEHNQTIQNLRHQIQQRDNEIAILVNMVAQNKGANTREETPETDSNSLSMFENLKKSRLGGIQELDNNERVSEAKVDDNGIPLYSNMLEGAIKRTAQRNARENQHNENSPLTEIPPSEVLADKHRALDFFKQVYPQNSIINENKTMLRQKYALAKQTGAQVNAARGEINALKQEIENLRAKRAMQSVVQGNSDPDSLEEKANEGELMERERQCLQSIEKEKHEYKRNFNELRQLKSEIEQIQKCLEKSRAKLQTDFEAWYSVMLKQGMSRPGDASSSQHSSQSKPRLHNQADTRENAILTNPRRRMKQIKQSPNISAVQSSIVPQTPESWTKGYEDENDFHSPYIPSNQTECQADINESKTSQGISIPLTGNPEADADIMAFYKAKEELLSRRK